jgi:hypothetical protein
MVDISAIAGLVSSLKAAGEITKAMVGLRDAAMIQGKVIELNGIILSAQSSALEANVSQFSLLEQVRGLERDIARLEAWDTEKERYELRQLKPAAFVYVLKKGEAGSEPSHAICPNCYQRGLKSILQSNGRPLIYEHSYDCPNCKTKVMAYPRQIGNEQD